jgi:hypothetical protein
LPATGSYPFQHRPLLLPLAGLFDLLLDELFLAVELICSPVTLCGIITTADETVIK